ncbi:MurR/RpiR family transcriptional regulator [Agrobacterium rubi]|uniref:MurR/RpiR family transcriptional regulator n=2 Tax=Agrobacterium rubi TaxID=28099 RepID=A0AAE7UQ92_9HYPH|nr:MurR/RpiR family transcriptional regulator [Agrobacterium rubi]MBP1878682.1 DNA-binding MurR/RpiR family transcriptional regulator [Agrobacterium rubi]MCL6652957.1 RpiR family transcriptional regulator [Agrobacterium rubi]NTE88695.1 MurR/RpiR family transcriptional regulator [Agrobacterium rubi]NTF04523.1 MurR/RpiR family transcriptional regulator [Agrobacterium rubi]NTF10055.1 MurR/RpiR family transcriptional regulator [Agrobacterium rubi]
MIANAAPATVEAFQERLLEVTDSLPKRLRQCADYIASNADRIAVSTVAELAEVAGVQPSAVMRFSQIMGFSGYSQMQKLFREHYTGGWPDYTTRLSNLRNNGEDGGALLLAEFVDAGRASLESVLNTVDPQEFETAIEVLAKASTLHIIGLRRSFAVASYLAYAFEKMGVPAMLHASVGQLHNESAIRTGDVVLAITFSPYSAETMDLVSSSLSRRIPVVALTDTAVSPMRKLGATILAVSEVDFGAFRSLSATLCVAIALAVGVGTHRQN